MKHTVRWVALDDFALRRRHSYGTIMIDVETKKVVDLIDSKHHGVVEDWLRTFPKLEIVSRDGAQNYKRAIADAHPEAIQVSDRFHLVRGLAERAKKEIESLVPRVVREREVLREEKSALPPTPSGKTREKLETIRQVRKRYEECQNINQLAREFHLHRATIQKYVNGEWSPQIKRQRPSILDAIKSEILQWLKEKQSIAAIHRKVLERGISTTYENVKHYVQRIRPQKDKIRVKTILRRHNLLRLLFNKGIADLGLSPEQQDAIKAYLKANKSVQDIIDQVTAFRIVLASQSVEALADWIDSIENSGYKQLKIFTKTIKKDLDAVRNAVILPISNGIAEGKINKLKVIKRKMYGRSSFATLKQKIFLTEYST